jgi:hypothetical protein
MTNSITIEVTTVAIGKVHDLCISELELYRNGKKLDLGMHKAVRFTKGDECGCGTEYDLVDRSGHVMARGSGGDLGDFGRWNSDGRLLADLRFNADNRGCELWIADTSTKRILFRRKLAQEVQGVQWVNDRLLRVTFEGMKDSLDIVVPAASSNQGAWVNVHAATPGLAGVKVQQFPDCSGDEERYRGRHPCMILFVFKDGRVHQVCYEPDGRFSQPDSPEFWWRLGKDDVIWSQLDRAFATP